MSETKETHKVVRAQEGEVPAKLIQVDKAKEFGEPPPAIMKTPQRVERGEVPANLPPKPVQQPTQSNNPSGTAGGASGGAGSGKE